MIYANTYGNSARIMVIGVGGGGTNAVNRMVEKNVDTVTLVAVNTDLQALTTSLVPEENKIQIGKIETQGLGAGSLPEKGKSAADESVEELRAAVSGMHLVFVVCGMGGGTGTGASPVIAKLAKESGALVIGVVTTPFAFEGPRRMQNAKLGIEKLSEYVDSMIIIPNNKLLNEVAKNKNIPLVEAFNIANEVLRQGITGISDLIVKPGLINLDFADIKTILQNQGLAHMGIGTAKGDNKIANAVSMAMRSPLLETTIEGASGIILNVTGSSESLSLYEVSENAMLIKDSLSQDANIIFGACIDESLRDSVAVTLIATGFGKARNEKVFEGAEQVPVWSEPKQEVVEEPTEEKKEEYEIPIASSQSQFQPDAQDEQESQEEVQVRRKTPVFLRKLFKKRED